MALFRRFGLTFCILALIAFAASCGMNQSPVAQDEATVSQAEDSRMLLAFSPEAAQRAAKIVQEGLTSSQLVGTQGGHFLINNGGLKVTFTVQENGLAADEQITMTVYGEMLSEVIVAFEPGGQVFLIDSQLELRLDNALVDLPLDGLQAWHIHDDGTVEPAGIVFVDDATAKTYITLDIPGFSRYSLGP